MSKVFISYARDGSFGENLAALTQPQLLSAGHTVFRDVINLHPGDRWDTKLEFELETSDVVVLIVSEKVRKSEWVHNEINRAKEIGLPIIPVLSEKVELPLWLRHLQTLDFSEKVQWEKLESAIGSHIKEVSDVVTPSTLNDMSNESLLSDSNPRIFQASSIPSQERKKGQYRHEQLVKKLPQDKKLVKSDGGEQPKGLLSWIFLHKWMFTITTLTALIISILFSLLATPVYRATTSLHIKPETLSLSDSTLTQPIPLSLEKGFYQTQYGLLHSRGLAMRVIESMAVEALFQEDKLLANVDDDEVEKTDQKNIIGRLRALFINDEATDSDDSRSSMINNFSKRLTVQQTDESQLFNVSFDHPDPQLAANVVNTLATNYIDMGIEEQVDLRRYEREYIIDQMEDSKSRLEAAQYRLRQYAKEKKLSSENQLDDIGYRSLKREVDANNQFLDSLILRLHKTRYAPEFNRVQIVDYATVPHKPYKPNVFFNMGAGLGVGLLLGLFRLVILRRKKKV